jgi:thiol-disulfide isomerase/thioredoxin
MVLVGGALLTFSVGCRADKADETLAAIAKQKAVQIKYEGDAGKYLAAQNERLTKLIELCDAFLAEFPKDARAPQVKLDLAQAYQGKAGFGQQSAEGKAKAAQLAGEVAAADASDDVKVQARLLLIRLATDRLSPNWDEAEKQAAVLLNDHPQHKNALSGQFVYAQSADLAGQPDRARKAYQLLVDKYPDSQYTKSAQGCLRRLGLVGKELTDFSFTDLNAKKVDLADYKGKVVLVDFWATWCGPCRAELPNVKETLAQYGEKGFAIIGVSLDSDRQKLLDFVQKENMTWPQYFDGKGWQCELGQRYGIMSIPATFLVDGKGVVRYLGVRGKALGEKVAELLAQ